MAEYGRVYPNVAPSTMPTMATGLGSRRATGSWTRTSTALRGRKLLASEQGGFSFLSLEYLPGYLEACTSKAQGIVQRYVQMIDVRPRSRAAYDIPRRAQTTHQYTVSDQPARIHNHV